MSPYYSEGSYTSESREVAISETWDSWANPQSMNNVEVVDGSLQLTETPEPPASAVHQFDAAALTGYSDGDPISTWPDEIGNLDLSGSGTYRTSGLNGNPAIEFDGSEDSFVNTFSGIASPYTVYAVAELTGNHSNDPTLVTLSDGSGAYTPYWTGGAWSVFAGNNNINGSSDDTKQQFTVIVDGVDSVLRENADQTASGDAGTDNATGIRISGFGVDGSTMRNWQGYISEVVFCDDRALDMEYESYLLDKWGVST